jgi:hypothetical protein
MAAVRNVAVVSDIISHIFFSEFMLLIFRHIQKNSVQYLWLHSYIAT